MTLEDAASVRRLVMGGVLLYFLWLVANSAFGFALQLKQQHQQQQQILQAQQREAAILLRQHNDNLQRQSSQTPTLQPTLKLALKPAPKLALKPAQTIVTKPSQQKMAASALVNRLRRVNAFGLVARPERRLHCTANYGGWDYTCLFHPDPITTTTWVQFGVRVDNAHVIEMSEAYPSRAPLPPPLSAATR